MKNIIKSVKFWCIGFIALPFAVLAQSQPYSDLVVFGGPLEDIGNFTSVAGEFPPPFYQGTRFSDGPLAIEFVAEQLGLELKPSLHRIGPVQGNNFSSLDSFASGDDPKDLAGQVEAYLSSRNFEADPDALYYMIIGGLEVIEATFEEDDSISRQLIENAVHAKEMAVRRLADAGAKTIFAPNFIDVSITPQIQRAGLSERGSKMSALHNRKFAKMQDRLERELDITLIRHDWATWTKQVLKKSAILGLTNTTDPCLELLVTGECDFPAFVFFNDLFPTGRVHELWGYELLSIIINHDDSCRKSNHGDKRCHGDDDDDDDK